MSKGFKVALPGYDAETDTNPAHFSVYVDGTEDHVLIKEKTRGAEQVNSGTSDTISHGLSYFPFVMACVETSTAGEYMWVHNDFSALFDSVHPFYLYVTTANLILGNDDVAARTFTYLVFHDKLVV